MKLPADVRALLARRYASRHRDWLAALVAHAGAGIDQQAGSNAGSIGTHFDARDSKGGEGSESGEACNGNDGNGSNGDEGAVRGEGRDGGNDDESGAAWPLVIALGLPTEAAALRQPDAVRAWAAAWRAWRGPGTLRWSERRWRVLGTQSLPQQLVLDGPPQVAAWIGELERWTRAEQRQRLLAGRWPRLAPRLPACFAALADYSDDDFERLRLVLEWLAAHPASGLYPRQIPVAGVDSKWMETRKGVLATLAAALLASASLESDFYAVCGLQRAPATARLRVLDPALRALLRGLGDITAPIAQLAALDLPVTTVLIVENLQSGLALPDLPGAVAFVALGYSVDLLGQLPWLRAARGIYWGDIDTHGYAILHRARHHLPQLESILMDEATLHHYAALWGEEGSQHGATDMPLLSAQEQIVYQALKNQRWGQNLRLEQERIPWPAVREALAALLSVRQPGHKN